MPLSPPLQQLTKHAPDPCGPCAHVSDGSRAPPFGHGEVDPPQTHAPPPGTHVKLSLDDPDEAPELVAPEEVFPDDVDVELAPPSFAPVLSSELHACVTSNAAVEKSEMKKSPRFMVISAG